MSVYDIPNVTVTPIGDPVGMYKIRANAGYYIHLPEHDELSYTTLVALLSSYDFSTVQIVAEADLPAGAEITGVGDNTEVM